MQKASLKEFEQYSQFQNLPQNITAIFTNRKLNLGFQNQTESQIKKNRQIILSKLDLKLEELICAKQIHCDNVSLVGKQDKGRGAVKYQDAIADTDAFITKEKNLAISIFIADCLPIFIIDKEKNIIALVHAGWRSTKKSLVKKTIFIMQQLFESNPKDIIVLFGPSIRKCCYQVGKEFLEYFKREIYKENNKIYLDLIGVNYLQLKEVGVIDENIFDSEICTSCQNDKFFSYRREKEDCGRQMTLIVRK